MVDLEAADVDIEIGQDRPLAPRLAKPGQPLHPHQLRFQPVYVQTVIQPCARRPVDQYLGTGQEYALRIADRDALQPGFAVNRSLDPRDADAKARRGLHLRDPIDDEPMPWRRVEKHERAGQQDQQHQDKRQQFIDQPPAPMAPPT